MGDWWNADRVENDRMVLLLDTTETPEVDRAAAISDLMVYAAAPCEVVHEHKPSAWARMSYTELSPVASCFTHVGSGLSLERTARHLRAASTDRFTVAVHGGAVGGHVQGGEARRLKARDLLITDLSSPYQYFWSGSARAVCFQLDYEALGLPVDMVRKAAARLEVSPLYVLVRDHVEQLCAEAETLAAGGETACRSAADATVNLIRAVVCSAVDDAKAVMAETLPARLLHYLHSHLDDASLDVDHIAAVHSLSVPQLRRVWSTLGLDLELEDWLVAERAHLRP